MHYTHTENSIVLKRKCREIGQSSPSMMWKRSIVQATAGCARAAVALALLLAVCASTWRGGECADLVIEIPGSGGGEPEAPDGGRYRLDYRPPHGTPAPNFTVAARANTINFVGLPGTKYHFMLYYSNATFADLLTWNQTIITAPEPPTNLTVTLGRNKQASISWSPPANGDYTGFRFKVIPLTERAEGGARNISVDGAGNWSYVLRELSPGATYQLHAFTLLHDKESAAYASRNFTTKPNTPGKFIVWFRNETTLLVLWQPPYPPGAYTHYKVSIVPPDARDSELYVEKEGEPPGPAQAAFKGLVPGRAYNISVQTVSEPEISAPTTAQYRTVPLRPRNVTAPLADLKETSFKVTWLPPLEESEFEKYQVSVSGSGGGARRLAPVLRARNDTPACAFDGLEPGAPYSVTVKTMSGKVTSWPATADLTLKPLAVRELRWEHAADGVRVWWEPAAGSTQDEYKVTYHEAGAPRDAADALLTADARVTLRALLPGRNYSVGVAAVSRGVASAPRRAALATRPRAPALLAARAAPRGLALAWRADGSSRQERYELRYRRYRPGLPASDDPDDYETLTTTNTSADLEGLFPGAVYQIQLAAVSYGLYSERHTLLKPVRPLPPRELRVWRATSNSARVAWAAPARAASALGGFALRYRPRATPAWLRLPPLPPGDTEAEISNMTHGEHYLIELDTLSEDADGEAVESEQPLRDEHTVRPNPVSNVEQLVDTRNMTLEWPRPGGRVEWYSLRWWPLEPGGAAGARNLSGPGAARTVRASLGGLEPGRGYKLSIAAHSYNLTSDLFTMETRTRPLIQSEMTIVNEPGTGDENDTLSTSLRVVYTRTPESASRFDSYAFRLEAAGSAPRELQRAADAPGQAVDFGALVPGRLYNVTMWTVSRNVTSHPVQRQARLYPRPITQLNATEIGAREITLAWDKPAGDYTDFEVQYLTGADQLQTHTTDELGITVGALRPHTQYTFTVVVFAGRGDALRAASRAHSARVATREAPPPAPARFRLTATQPSALNFSWELAPSDANGVLRRFLVEYAPQTDPERITTLEFRPDARSGAVTGLQPGVAYLLSVRGETGAGAGAAARLLAHPPIGAPPPPAPTAAPQEVRRSSSTVAVRFRADYFSAANGNVTAYTLVLAERPRNDTPARLPSWRDVHALDAWPPYQVTEPYYPFHSSPVEEFTIGSERCDAGGRAYCNGPLKPGTKYFVKLRAFTALDKFTDTGYTVVYTEVDNTAWIVGACAGMAAAAGGAAALAALRRPARARVRLHRPLPPHVRRLRLQVQRGVRGAKARGARAGVLGRRPARQPAQEPLHQHPALRPLALQVAARGRRGGLRLHQRQLRARAQLAARVHRHAGPAALHARRLLAHVLGVGQPGHRHAHALRGEGPREVRPLLALRHAARVLRRHRRHSAQRVALPRLDRDGAHAVPRRGAARAQALPLHHVAGLRRARPAHHAGTLRADLPRALPARLAARGRALQRRRGPLRHLHHAGHRAAAAGEPRGVHRHLRHGARHAARARVDGADGAAVHLHPPVPRGRAGGAGPGRAAAQQPQPPPQRRLRRRRGHRGVGHVTARRGLPAERRAHRLMYLIDVFRMRSLGCSSVKFCTKIFL